MDRDSRWATLQLHLKAAKAARDEGDLERALSNVDAALAIDPDFIAARMLRESIAAPGAPPPPSPSHVRTERAGVVSADTYATIEARAKRRRIDQRLGVATGSIAAGRLAEATAALEELAILDPALPQLPRLAAELNAKRDTGRRRRALAAGVSVLAASAIVGVGLGLLVGSWPAPETAPVAPVEESATVSAAPAPEPQTHTQAADTHPPVAAAEASAGNPADTPLVAAVEPPAAPVAEPASELARAVPGAAVAPPPSREPRRAVEAPPAAAVVPPSPAPPAPVATRPAATETVAVSRVAPPIPEPTAVAPPEATLSAAAPSAPAPVAAAVPFTDDAALIRETLQRYRRAYNGLDARLAHAVYPGVDESALAHAFEGLHSQSLEFDSCTLDTQEASARAVCRGSARYVPKVGSRAPRAEPRVWTFRLNKDKGDWKITSAWTDR